jgi:hypothetical protein
VVERELLQPEESVCTPHLHTKRPFLPLQVVDPVALEPQLDGQRVLAVADLRRHVVVGARQQDAALDGLFAFVGQPLEVLVCNVDGEAIGPASELTRQPVRHDPQPGLDDVLEEGGEGVGHLPFVQQHSVVDAGQTASHEQEARQEQDR